MYTVLENILIKQDTPFLLRGFIIAGFFFHPNFILLEHSKILF